MYFLKDNHKTSQKFVYIRSKPIKQGEPGKMKTTLLLENFFKI